MSKTVPTTALSCHRVKRITVSKTKQVSVGGCYRRLLIITEDGYGIELTVFGEDPSDLNISFPTNNSTPDPEQP